MLLAALSAAAALAQAPLSQNSGINPNDTYYVCDVTISAQATVYSSQPAYSTTLGAMTNSIPASHPARTYHVEAGYDTSGNVVLNLFPADPQQDLVSGMSAKVSAIRFAGGQLAMFDEGGNPISVSPPPGVNMPEPMALLGPTPNTSLLSGMVVSNVAAYASANGGTATWLGGSPDSYAVARTVRVAEGGSSNRTFVQQNGVYVVSNYTFTPVVSSGSASLSISFANMSWNQNASADAARIGRGAAPKPPPARGTQTFTTPAFLFNGCPEQVYQGLGSQNIVLQHGLFACSNAWNRMFPWLNQHFIFGTTLIPSLTSTNGLASQGNDLINRILTQGGGGYILVGHSQGGLIDRYVAQYFFANHLSNTFDGVVTVDTPHQGAPIALTGVGVVEALVQLGLDGIAADAGCGDPDISFLGAGACAVAQGLADNVQPLFEFANQAGVSSLVDLQPFSAFLQNLNSVPETFPRFGIISNADRRWNEMRLAGDAFSNPEATFGGRNLASFTEDVYEGFFADEILADFFGDQDQADADAQLMADMDAVDALWNELVTPLGGGSDAVVPSSSQTYPGGVNFSISNADSHVGALKSDKVRDALIEVLDQNFHVLKQGGCGLTTSPTSANFGPGGGTQTFTVMAPTGCGWSASASTDWITFPSADSGSASGSFSISVPAFSSAPTRMGLVEVDEPGAPVAIKITQAGTCAFSLDAPTSLFPAAGGNGVINVSAPSGCAWSAVSNETWLTITSGQTGTGNGWFAYTVSPNSAGANLAGTISVMDQTANVTVGDNVGAPGTGSITINGAPEDFPTCGYDDWGDYVCDDNWDTGSVTIRVGTATATWGYDGDSDSSTLAGMFADSLNGANSPVTAVASGNTIYITSKLTGAATNYSMSTSFTSYPSSYPAFAAQLSGAALTGGHN